MNLLFIKGAFRLAWLILVLGPRNNIIDIPSGNKINTMKV